MMPGIESLPLLSLLVLMISAFAMPLIKNLRWVKGLSITAMLSAFVMNGATFVLTQVQGGFFYRVGHFDAPVGIEFWVGQLETLLGTVFTLIALAIMIQASQQIGREIHPGKVPLFFLLSHILVASLLGIVFANDLFNVYVFIEIGNLAASGLIILKDTRASIKAGLKYLIMSCLGSGLILLGIAWIYTMTGHLNMTAIHAQLAVAAGDYPHALLLAVGLFTVGLAVKTALFPLHAWLPDAYSAAPAPAAALLSSIAAKAYIVFLIHILFRLTGTSFVTSTPLLDLLLILGSLAMVMGSLMAIFQPLMRQVIAYSSIAQIGYIYLAIGLGTPLGLALAVYHIIGHALTKATLFLTVGSLTTASGATTVADLRGVGRKMPVTMALLTAATFSLIGIPVLPGFISKWQLSLAGIEAMANLPSGATILAGRGWLFAVLLVLSGLLNAIYLLPFSINGYFRSARSHEAEVGTGLNLVREQRLHELLPAALLVVAMTTVGFLASPILNLIQAGLIEGVIR